MSISFRDVRRKYGGAFSITRSLTYYANFQSTAIRAETIPGRIDWQVSCYLLGPDSRLC